MEQPSLPVRGVFERSRDPAALVEAPSFCETLSIAVCPLTSEPIDAPILPILVQSTPENGLRATSRLGQCIGRLADDDLLRLNRSLLVFLGLAR